MTRIYAIAAFGTMATAAGAAPAASPIVYNDATWRSLVADSYQYVGGNPANWDRWIDSTWRERTGVPVEEWIRLRRQSLGQKQEPDARQAEIVRDGKDLHRLIKASIKKFSLERGYEFAYTVSRNERQCLLQSALIAAILAKVGARSGIAMVWAGETNNLSNLAHVVPVVDLPGGRRAIFDASEPHPMGVPCGIMAMAGGQLTSLRPVYNSAGIMTAATYASSGKPLALTQLDPLPVSYERSQFRFYRAERVPDGLLGNPPKPAALAKSAEILKQTLAIEPRNMLARYSLGKIYRRQGANALAIQEARRAYGDYQRAGYVPSGMNDLYQWAMKSAG